MIQPRAHRTRAALYLAFAAVALGAPAVADGSAPAPPSLDECVDAHSQAQVNRKSGDLLRARDRLKTCSNAACPDIARVDCTKWLSEIYGEIPTVVLGARYADGTDAAGVRVRLNGDLLTERLDGRALEMNPGVHTLRFEADGAQPKEQRVVLREGERNRSVMVTLDRAQPLAPAEPLAPPESPSISPLVYVFAGVGVVGFAGFGALGLTGMSRESDLDACKPNCATSDVDAVRTRYLAADISLAVGLIGVGAASYLYFTRDQTSPNTGAAVDVGVRVYGREDGFSASVAGTF